MALNTIVDWLTVRNHFQDFELVMGGCLQILITFIMSSSHVGTVLVSITLSLHRTWQIDACFWYHLSRPQRASLGTSNPILRF